MDFSKYKTIEFVYDNFLEKAENIMADEADCNNIYLINRLLVGKRGKASRTTFFCNKKDTCALYQELVKDGIASEASLSYVKAVSLNDVIDQTVITTRFFESLDAVINFIDMVSTQYNGDKTSGCVVKTIIILNWYGFSTDEILNVKKADFIPKGRLIKKGNEVVMFGEKEYNELLRFRNASEYKEVVTGRVCELVESDYLMRGVKNKGEGRFFDYSIRTRLSLFSRRCERFGKVLDITKLRRNAMYCKAWEDGITDSEARKVFEKTYGVSDFKSLELASEYKKWVRIFKSNDCANGLDGVR